MSEQTQGSIMGEAGNVEPAAGSAGRGQLGDGTVTNRANPVQSGTATE